MTAEPSRSEQVVEDYKKRKLARSALRHIHSLIHGFEQDRAVDRRLAWIGVAIIVIVLATGSYFLLAAESVVVG